MRADERREVAEAVAAGRRALTSLETAADALGSASNWGLFDILAGGIISSLVKRSRLDDAEEALERARADLYAFTREVSDVRGIEELRVNVGGLASALDILVDNPFVDLTCRSASMTPRRTCRRRSRQPRRCSAASRH